MQGLTAKVFRTYNASYTMAELLKNQTFTGNIAEKVKLFNDANRTVAILCNHKRTVGAAHAGQMEKMEEKVKGVVYQKWRVKQMILDLDPKQKKKKGAAYFELDEELDKTWVKEHQKYLVQELRDKTEKKFAKENEKRVADGEKEMKRKELDERLQAADELAEKFKKENKTGKVEVEGRGATVEKMEANIEKMEARIANMRVQAEDKENNKEVALGTSKIVSSQSHMKIVVLIGFRITLTLVSPWFSPRSMTCPLRSYLQRLFETNSSGQSSLQMRIGSSDLRVRSRPSCGIRSYHNSTPSKIYRRMAYSGSTPMPLRERE